MRGMEPLTAPGWDPWDAVQARGPQELTMHIDIYRLTQIHRNTHGARACSYACHPRGAAAPRSSHTDTLHHAHTALAAFQYKLQGLHLPRFAYKPLPTP